MKFLKSFKLLKCLKSSNYHRWNLFFNNYSSRTLLKNSDPWYFQRFLQSSIYCRDVSITSNISYGKLWNNSLQLKGFNFCCKISLFSQSLLTRKILENLTIFAVNIQQLLTTIIITINSNKYTIDWYKYIYLNH